MKNIAKLLGAAAICGGVMIGSAAHADTIVLQNGDREVIQQWAYDNYHGCPPGTVMQENKRLFGLMHPYHNCVPDKNATVTVYQPGTIIPDTVTYTELPSTVTAKLPPAPAGDVYVSSGSGVYVLNPRTRTVVDTIKVYDND